jgi:hypothetical protein
MAQVAWSNVQPSAAEPSSSASIDDPRLAAAPVTAPAPASVMEPAPLISPKLDALVPAAVEVANADSLPAGVSDSLPPLYSRLEELGASDPELGTWGSTGQMYRFCCRAALADTPAFARHFEAVAAEPLAAVEQVVAKVEAWRAIQRGPGLQ